MALPRKSFIFKGEKVFTIEKIKNEVKKNTNFYENVVEKRKKKMSGEK